MLATAEPGARTTAADTEETRPVRLLVPTTRRSDYWLPLEDTLRASDLGVTRHTTDAELTDLVDAAATMLTSAGLPENPTNYLLRIRDALRCPRDITEARDWGFEIPHKENAEEFDERPSKRLGWWWVYDPTRVETRAQRAERYLSDHRVIDMRGFARVVLRAYITVKDRKIEADNIRLVLNNAEHRDMIAQELVRYDPSLTLDEARARLIAKAKDDELKAMPVRRDRYGQSDVWYVRDAIDYGRDTTRLDQWYEYNKIAQTGRPKGAKTRRRTTK